MKDNKEHVLPNQDLETSANSKILRGLNIPERLRKIKECERNFMETESYV